MLRREFLAALSALAGSLPAAATIVDYEPGLQLGEGEAFTPDFVRRRAEAMAAKTYAPRPMVPQPWVDISYDQYRSIWFDTRNALWEGTDTP
ncbi:MAG: glucan biosynthesis protein, partial [Pseudomonadota bacterium]